MTEAIKEIIEKRLKVSFSPSFLELLDNSHLHVGHKGNPQGGKHFKLKITAHVFEKENRLKRQQMVLEVLKDLLPFPVHSISMQVQGK